MQKKEIEKLFYIDKNYSEIKELLKDNSEFRSFNILGRIELQLGNINKAYEYFNKSKSVYGCSYCLFLEGKLQESLFLANLVKNSSPAVNWLIFLINLLEDNKVESPTYFQIRNFYEQDLNMLFKYQKFDLINKIIKENSYLEFFNREIYKYTARVLLTNNQIYIAEQLLLKSLDILYKDPETHYMLGEIYQKQDNIILAEKEYRLSDEVNNGYFPAKKKLKELATN